MNLPPFTAQASLYRTRNRYRSSATDFGGSIPADSFVAAYIPGPETMNACNGCLDGYAVARNLCTAKVFATAIQTCSYLGFFAPPCVAAQVLFLEPACYAGYAIGEGYCHIPGGVGPLSGPCCPIVCGVHNPLVPGSGCCDSGETCVGSDSPNTRDGCCPKGQYCNGNCCAIGDSCCGGTCCPAGNFCIEGGYWTCDASFSGYTTTTTTAAGYNSLVHFPT